MCQNAGKTQILCTEADFAASLKIIEQAQVIKYN